MAGPKRRIQERLAGFPALSAHIVDMFSAGDKVAVFGAELVPDGFDIGLSNGWNCTDNRACERQNGKPHGWVPLMPADSGPR